MSISRISARRPSLRRNAYVRRPGAHGHYMVTHSYERAFGPKRLKPDIHGTELIDKQRNWWHSYVEDSVVRVEPLWGTYKIEANKLTDERLEAIAHELSKIVRGRISTSMLAKSRHESRFLQRERPHKSGDTNEGS